MGWKRQSQQRQPERSAAQEVEGLRVRYWRAEIAGVDRLRRRMRTRAGIDRDGGWTPSAQSGHEMMHFNDTPPK